MPRKEFHTRRQWHNTTIWAVSALILMLLGVVIAARSGQWSLLLVLGAVVAVGFVVNYFQDRAADANYSIDGSTLRLHLRKEDQAIERSEIRDASLLDRAAARNYIREKLAVAVEKGLSKAEAKAREKGFIRFCTVDIGLRSFTFGIGRQLADTMPNAKNDLVLLRLRSGEDLLLSPEYNQAFIESIGRMLDRA
ncbi:MAG: hypothetical protein JNL05_06190 [Flavobacteriales bacterium]|nr:hypothetical protein [Flavobacteriales bacterium]